MSIVLQSTGGGSVSIVEPTTASNFTQTLPASTGTVMVSGNMPAFSAYINVAQSISTGTATKLQFGAETFDTNSYFDNTTNYRFTPLIAGYYQINGQVSLASGATGYQVLAVYKNGSAVFNNYTISNTAGPSSVINNIIYFNGSTDYIELYMTQTTGISQSTNNGSLYSQFSGVLVRSA
jgi:hypothetical protein